jgi:cytochrome P450
LVDLQPQAECRDQGGAGALFPSHEYGGSITIADRRSPIPDRPKSKRFPNINNMDAPERIAQRRTVAPAFTPSEMTRRSDDIRRRTAELLNTLPVGRTFDWVDTVSVELTTQMLAILFDFPWDDRRLLPFRSDWAGNIETFTIRRSRRNASAISPAC